jgi:hypothetical protein
VGGGQHVKHTAHKTRESCEGNVLGQKGLLFDFDHCRQEGEALGQARPSCFPGIGRKKETTPHVGGFGRHHYSKQHGCQVMLGTPKHARQNAKRATAHRRSDRAIGGFEGSKHSSRNRNLTFWSASRAHNFNPPNSSWAGVARTGK